MTETETEPRAWKLSPGTILNLDMVARELVTPYYFTRPMLRMMVAGVLADAAGQLGLDFEKVQIPRSRAGRIRLANALYRLIAAVVFRRDAEVIDRLRDVYAAMRSQKKE